MGCCASAPVETPASRERTGSPSRERTGGGFASSRRSSGKHGRTSSNGGGNGFPTGGGAPRGSGIEDGGGFSTAQQTQRLQETTGGDFDAQGGENESSPPPAFDEGMRSKGMTERLTVKDQVKLRQGGREDKPREGRKGTDEEVEFIKEALDNTMIFHQFDETVRESVARVMYELQVPQGQKLITEGEMGSELYLVYEGIFDVTENRHGVEVKVNHKARGAFFGEISLMFQSPRTASVVAATDASVWVLERALFRSLTRKAAMDTSLQHEVG